jgi:hypothetical protein
MHQLNRTPSTASADGHSSLPRHRLEALWLFVCWVPYALLTHKFYFLCDDAFISLRYAKNWAAGNGLRYNLGDHLPVEGYSNFLWVCTAALGELAKLDPWVFMPLISFLSGTALLVALFYVLGRDFKFSLPVVVLGTLFLACCPSFAVWSTSGLETAPFALLVFLTTRQLLLRSSGPAGLSAGLLGLALALIRAEGIEWAVLIGLLAVLVQLLRRQRALKPHAVYFAVLLLGYGAYFAWRYTYYGLPFPNTAYVKVALSAATLARGGKYVAVMYLTLLAPLVALTGWPLAWRRALRPKAAPVALLAVAFPAYAVLVGGDFMTMGRLLVPSWPFHAILLALLLTLADRPGRLLRAAALAPGLAVVVIGALPAWDIHLVPRSVRSSLHFRLNTDVFRSEYAQWEYMAANTKDYAEWGRVLKRISQPGDSLVTTTIGAIGYYSDLFIYDRYGLVTREVVESAGRGTDLHSPGHDLRVPPEFFAKCRATFLDMVAVPLGPQAGPSIRAEVRRWRSRVDPNLYAPQIVNVGRITGSSGAPLLVVLRLPPEGVSPEEMWSRYRADLALWSI